jgi:hypothetical protein
VVDASEPVWYVKADVKRFTSHPFGQDVLKLAEKLIREETGDMDLSAMRAKAAEVIGFDPLDGIERITVYGLVGPFEGKVTSEEQLVEKMATSGVLVVRLSGSPGNLEGLALATPGYQSAEYHGTTIHSGVLPDFEPRVYMAVHKPEGGQPSSVVIGLQEDQVKQAVDRLLGRVRLGSAIDPVSGPSTDDAPGAFFTASLKLDDKAIRALNVPEQHSAVVKMLQRLTVSLGAEGESVVARVSADVVDEKRAEQIQQLLQGVIAFVQLPIEELEAQEEFVMVRGIVKDMKVSRSGNRVTCQLSRPGAGLLDEILRLVD